MCRCRSPLNGIARISLFQLQMKKNFIFALICVLVSTIGFAQQITVKDYVTHELLSGAVISTPDGTTNATTNAIGQADVSAFKNAGAISFSLIGFENLTISYKELEAMNGVVYLRESGFYLNEAVVSASKFEEKSEDVAQQVQVIDQRDISFISPQNSADLLQQSGNVLVQKSQQGGGSPVMRGFEANKVLLVVDGVRMNNAIYRGGHLQNVLTLDNTILDKVELVMGPGSVVYGSDALGGVMHFYTKNPELGLGERMLVKGNAFVRSATANQELSGHIDLNLGGRRFASLTSLTYSNFDDLRTGDLRAPNLDAFGRRSWYVERIDGRDSVVANNDPNLQIGSAYKQFDVLQKFLFKQNDKVQHILNIQYSNTGDIPRYDRLTDVSGGLPVRATWYYGPQTRKMFSYNLNLKNRSMLYDNALIVIAMQDIDETRHTRRFTKTTTSHNIENVKVYSLNADFQKQMGKNELRYGAEVTYNDVKSSAYRENVNDGEKTFLNARYPDGGSNMTNLALYATDTWEINEHLVLNAGLRFSNVSLSSKIDSTDISVNVANGVDTTKYYFLNNTSIEQNNSAFNGNLGLIYMPGNDWRFSALVSTGFRAPNVDDVNKLFDAAPGTFLLPNKDLKPEYATNFDFAIDKTIQKRVNVKATGFYTILKNAITSENAPFTPNIPDFQGVVGLSPRINVNKDEAYIMGVSSQFSAVVNQHFDISSSINYTYGRIKGDSTDTPLDHIPPVFGKTSFNLQFNKFRTEFWVMYNGWKKTKDYRLGTEDNEAYATADGMPAWYTLNIRTQYQITDKFQVQASLDNILNMHYRVFASGISAPGRNLMVTLRARF
jgi:hemoglobin/transferrin/lactoferrin receptor protein